MSGARERAAAFCPRYGLRVPILMAPMAGACPVGLAAAVANAGGMGGLGALMTAPDGDRGLGERVPRPEQRRVPDQSVGPRPAAAARPRARGAGARLSRRTGDRRCRRRPATQRPLDFAAQCEAMIDAAPPVVSSIMGLFPADIRRRAEGARHRLVRLRDDRGRGARGRGGRRRRDRRAGVRGRRPSRRVRCRCGRAPDGRAVRAGAAARRRAVGAGHRGRRHRRRARGRGGADPGRQRGADRHGACCAARRPGSRRPGPTRSADLDPEATMPTRAFSGRLGRSIATDYVRAAAAPDAPAPAPYPVQRGLTAAMREAAGAGRRCAADAGLGRPGGGAGPRRSRPPNSCAGSGRRRRRCCRANPAASGSNSAVSDMRCFRCIAPTNDPDNRYRGARGVLRPAEKRRRSSRSIPSSCASAPTGRSCAWRRSRDPTRPSRSTRWRPASTWRRCSS